MHGYKLQSTPQVMVCVVSNSYTTTYSWCSTEIQYKAQHRHNHWGYLAIWVNNSAHGVWVVNWLYHMSVQASGSSTGSLVPHPFSSLTGSGREGMGEKCSLSRQHGRWKDLMYITTPVFACPLYTAAIWLGCSVHRDYQNNACHLQTYSTAVQ